MRESLTKRILETLIEITADSFYLFVAIHEAGYGASQKKIERKFWELKEGSSRPKDFRRRRHNFYSFLSKLKKDGLIEQRESKWRITKAGRKKYKFIIERLPFKRKYRKEADSTIKLIIFDIPEKERWKRQWLREKLGELGFKMIQKSVWAGKFKLPEEFIEDLGRFNLLEYVEVLAITRTGSLQIIG